MYLYGKIGQVNSKDTSASSAKDPVEVPQGAEHAEHRLQQPIVSDDAEGVGSDAPKPIREDLKTEVLAKISARWQRPLAALSSSSRLRPLLVTC